ncbi:hypothetical protein [Gloeocapsa sp. PCC 73106]|uniref:hypothetical protein n=1 Tax=Gloeocapsa sp. PCC 73106 TaxID=102232 RepID=UPI0002ABE751|nr:hypothetical protein [Gloeocapsa sp. PCC 73106]ELR97819.1 hypothetical protein GLO73106DRAFT_00016360 [Gloeocapsa sp. PCC 73106]
MKAQIRDKILYIDSQDLPNYQKGGSIVRNNYFWALKSISCHSPRGGDWEFESEVWIALARMLLFFTQSGYLRYDETSLDLPEDTIVPEVLRDVIG